LHNVAVAENNAFGLFALCYMMSPTDFALRRGVLLTQTIGHLLLFALCCLKLHNRLQCVARAPRPETLSDTRSIQNIYGFAVRKYPLPRLCR
jgi:hypothetical protein